MRPSVCVCVCVCVWVRYKKDEDIQKESLRKLCQFILDAALNLYRDIYIYICICIVCIYIYIHIAAPTIYRSEHLVCRGNAELLPIVAGEARGVPGRACVWRQ